MTSGIRRFVPLIGSVVLMVAAIAVGQNNQASANPAGPEGGLDVNVVNTPLPVTGTSKQVVNTDETGFMPIGEVSHPAVELFTVPAGQRLVITSAAVGTFLNECPFTLNPRIRLPDTGNNFPLGEVSPSIRGLNPVRYINQTTYPVTIYVGAEELVSFDAFRSDGTCSTGVQVSITGYLEDDI